MLGPREIPLLHDFAVVCKDGNLSKAAHTLNTVQSAVSQRMQRLEQAVGAALLVRHSRGVVPTEQGLILLKYAKRLDGFMADAVAEIEDWQGSPSGSISIGLPPSVSTVLTTPLIEAMNIALPNVELTVAEAFSGYLHGWLENDEIDFGFVFNQMSTRTMEVFPILAEELYLLTTPEEASNLPTTITLNDVAKLPLIAPSRRHGLRTDVEEAAMRQGIQLNIRLELDAGNQLIRQIVRGLGSAVLARSAVMPELSEGVLVAIPICKPSFRRTVCLAMKKDTAASYLHIKAREQILMVIKTLVEERQWLACYSTLHDNQTAPSA